MIYYLQLGSYIDNYPSLLRLMLLLAIYLAIKLRLCH